MAVNGSQRPKAATPAAAAAFARARTSAVKRHIRFRVGRELVQASSPLIRSSVVDRPAAGHSLLLLVKKWVRSAADGLAAARAAGPSPPP